MNEPKKILCIKLWGLGNLIIIWPLVYKIKEKYPSSSILFLTFDINKEFLSENKTIGKIIYFKFTKNIFAIVYQFVIFVRRLRREKIEVVINFETFNNTSALLVYLTGASMRIGLNNKYERIFYNCYIDNDQTTHISQKFVRLLKFLDIDSSYNYYYFAKRPEQKERIETILNKFKIEKFIGIHPGTSVNLEKGRRWKPRNFSELSKLLIEHYHLPLIYTGTEKEKPLINDILEKMPMQSKILNLAGLLNIWEFIELLRKSFLFISNDTGPVHIAASLGINVVVFYGQSFPDRCRPLNSNNLVFYKNLTCSPCDGISYINKKCKNNFRCLDFSPQEVFLKISEEYFNEKN